MTVVDASVVLELLVPTDPARHDAIAQRLPQPATPWLAPDILAFEVFSVVCRHVRREKLSKEFASRALRRLTDLPIELVPTVSLIGPAWEWAPRYSTSIALYTALALRARESLLTADPRLADAARDAGAEVLLLKVPSVPRGVEHPPPRASG